MADISNVTNFELPTVNEAFANNVSNSVGVGATVVELNNTAPYTDGDFVVLTIDPDSPKQATFAGKVDGNNIIDVVWTEGNLGASHDIGATVADYVSATHYALISKHLSKSLNQDGTLKSNIVSTAKIGDNQVTTAKIGDNQVTTAKIGDNQVTTAKIANSSITAVKTNFGGNYSTSEVNTGFTWVNGKSIYKKTISTGALPNATSKTVAHGVTGYEHFIDISGWASNGSIWTPLPYSPSGSTVPQAAVLIAVVGGNISLETATNRSAYTVSYVTLHYTKV